MGRAGMREARARARARAPERRALGGRAVELPEQQQLERGLVVRVALHRARRGDRAPLVEQRAAAAARAHREHARVERAVVRERDRLVRRDRAEPRVERPPRVGRVEPRVRVDPQRPVGRVPERGRRARARRPTRVNDADGVATRRTRRFDGARARARERDTRSETARAYPPPPKPPVAPRCGAAAAAAAAPGACAYTASCSMSTLANSHRRRRACASSSAKSSAT